MPVHVSDERARKAAAEILKSRKIGMIRDLGELADALEVACEYVDKAIAVCVRPTHVLKGEGVAQLIDLSEMIRNYLRSANEIIQELRTGKAKV